MRDAPLHGGGACLSQAPWPADPPDASRPAQMPRLCLSLDARRLALHQFSGRAGERAARGSAARQQWRGAAAGADRRPRHRRSAGVHRRRCHCRGRGRSDPERLEADRGFGASGDAARRPAPRARRGAGGFSGEAFCEEEKTEIGARRKRASAHPTQFRLGCHDKNQKPPGRRLPMNRRELLKAAAALPLAQAVLPNPLFAQGPWPTRNITMIVPFPAGGQADLAARPVALALERILGKPVIVDNRAGGAGGSIGNAAAARAEPDGYTLLMTLSSLAVLPEADRLFDRSVAYEVSQFAPVARVLADPTLLAVPAAAPWKTLQDFVDDAKKRPGQIPYGSSGPYGTLHVAMEMFAASAGIKLLHVPFRGAGPALTALLSGTVQALASAPGTLKQQVDDGKMRVLANWGAERIASFPDLPTFKELG